MKEKLTIGTILLVDDVIENLQLLSDMLVEKGYKIRAVKNGHEAMASVNTELPDLILLDIILPDIDGYEVCRKLKSDENTSTVPVIFLSALNEPSEKLKGFASGGVDFITKPFFSEEVLIRVKTHIEISRLQTQLNIQAKELKFKNELLSTEIFNHKKSEESRNASEDKFKYIFDYSNIGKSITLLTGEMNVNQAFCDLIGYTKKELQNKKWQDITHPDDIDLTQHEIDKLISGEINKVRFNKRYINKNGSIIWTDLSSSIRRNTVGEPLYFMTSLLDITEHKLVQESLQASETRYRRLFESAKDGIIILDAGSGLIVDINPFLTEMLGYSKEQLLKKAIWEIGFFKDVVANREKFEELQQKKYVRYENLPLETVDGRKVYVEFVSSVYLVNHHKVIQCNIRDITERKLAEDVLAWEQYLIHLLLDNLPNYIYFKDRDSKFIRISSSLVHLFKLNNPLEAIGKSDFDFFTEEHARQAFDDEQQIIRTGQPITKEEKETWAENKDTWVSTSKFPLRDKEGNIIGTFGISMDITSRKEFEIKLQEKNKKIEAQNEEYQQLNEELLQTNEELEEAKDRAEESDRLKTAFLQNMSHEIRTPMNAIMGFADLITEQFDDKIKLERFSKIIHQRSSDLLDIMNEILDIAKIESGMITANFEECKLVPLFSEISMFFKEFQIQQGKEQIEFNIEVDCGTSAIIRTDKVKLKQIFINLISNAFKFTDIGKIKAGCKTDENNQLIFYVSDTGIGIPAEKQNFIFERFAQVEHSPDRLYGGTGLGLSIVKGLIDILGGKIWLKSKPGKGSSFYFSFPYEIIEPKTKDQSMVEEPEKYNFSNKTILIVEDDIYNSEYLKEVLSETGFKILQTIYGKEAVQISKTQQLDIVLMDIRLPDIDGYIATRQIRKQKPELKIIAQTAYAANDDKENAINAGCNDYISKPVNRDLLLSMLNKHLTKR